MKHFKEERLLIEATVDEVNELKQKIVQIIIEILIQIRICCNLNKKQAAEVADLDRKTLTAHENGEDMYLSTLCHDIATFVLFMRHNKIKANRKLWELKNELPKLLTI